jgi:hypothetical protein
MTFISREFGQLSQCSDGLDGWFYNPGRVKNFLFSTASKLSLGFT